MKKNGFNFTIILCLLCCLFGCSNNSKPITPEESTTINIFGINDFHGCYEETNSEPGLSKIGEYLISEKENNPDNTIILSSGDMWQGTIESNLNRGALVTECMNAIGFDSMTIGNHEFDWNEDPIYYNEENMNFPLLGCNIFYKGTKNRPSYLTPYTIVSKSDFKIGIIGAVQQGIGSDIIRSVSDKFDFVNPVDYIKEYSDILYNEKDCDAIILSTHDGDFRNYYDLTKESAVSKQQYVNAIFLGHDHNNKNGNLNGMPYVEGGKNGRYISKISLTIKKSEKSTTVSSTSSILDTKNVCQKTSSVIENIYSKYKPQIDEQKNEEVGIASKTLSNDRLGNVANQAMISFVNNNQSEFKKKVNYSAINKGGIRSNISEGVVNYGDIYKCFPFDNHVVVFGLNIDQYEILSLGGFCYVLTTGDIEPADDGLYYLVTLDYVFEQIKDNTTNNYYSPTILRDAIKEEVKKGNIDLISPIK